MRNQNSPSVVATSLYKMSLDGTDIDQLTQPVGNSHDGWPKYSPNRQKIVFTSDRLSSDGSLDIFTVNADGTGMKRIATGVTVGGCADQNCVNPAWGRSPLNRNLEPVPDKWFKESAYESTNAEAATATGVRPTAAESAGKLSPAEMTTRFRSMMANRQRRWGNLPRP
jgi:hypothetical protein